MMVTPYMKHGSFSDGVEPLETSRGLASREASETR